MVLDSAHCLTDDINFYLLSKKKKTNQKKKLIKKNKTNHVAVKVRLYVDITGTGSLFPPTEKHIHVST